MKPVSMRVVFAKLQENCYSFSITIAVFNDFYSFP